MKKRRLLAWLMTLVMMIGLMPATALADTTSTQTNLRPGSLSYNLDGTLYTGTAASDAPITLSKTADGPKEDGSYDVTLSVTTKQQIKPKPTEVVFVLDASTSMKIDASSSAERADSDDKQTDHNNRWNAALKAIKTVVTKLVIPLSVIYPSIGD